MAGSYKAPLGGHSLLLSVLPIRAVEPTPFQRDLSDIHHKRLADVINKTGRFLAPIIATVTPNDGFWTPNGRPGSKPCAAPGRNVGTQTLPRF